MKMPLPKEHGAWGMLLVSMLLGQGVAGQFNFNSLLLWGAVLLLFVARQPLQLLRQSTSQGHWSARDLRLWAWGYLGGVLALGFVLLSRGLWGLTPVALAAAGLLWLQLGWQGSRQRRSLKAELAGAAGLTLTAPAAYYATIGVLDATGWSLWPILVAYYFTGIYHVRWRLRHPDDRRRGAWNLAMQAGLVLVSWLFGIYGALPRFLFLAFLPGMFKAVQAQAVTSQRTPVKRVGWVEVVYSLLFLGVAMVAYGIG